MTKNIVVSLFALVSLSLGACGLQTAEPGEEENDVNVYVEPTECDPTVNVDCGCAGAASSSTGGQGNEPSTGGQATGGTEETGGTQATGGTEETGGTQATGGTEETGGTSGYIPPTGCEESYGTIQDPVGSPAKLKLVFSKQYMPLSTEAYLVGAVPSTSDWVNGPEMTDSGSYWSYTLPEEVKAYPGKYRFQYVDLIPSTSAGTRWANFGTDEDRLRCMSDTARAWVYCNFYEGTVNGCELAMRIATDGTITPDGNMADWE